jgi:hypothetical protein
MALTAAEKLSAYEILGVTHGPGAGGANEDIATIHNAFGVSLSLTDMDTLRDEVDVYLDNLQSDVETRVAAIIADYDEIRDNYGVRVEAGSVGDVSGVSVDFDEMKRQIRARLMTFVPVIHMVESFKMRSGPDAGPSLTFAR